MNSDPLSQSIPLTRVGDLVDEGVERGLTDMHVGVIYGSQW